MKTNLVVWENLGLNEAGGGFQRHFCGGGAKMMCKTGKTSGAIAAHIRLIPIWIEKAEPDLGAR